MLTRFNEEPSVSIERLFIAKIAKALYLINLIRDRDRVIKIMEFQNPTELWMGTTDGLSIELNENELKILTI